MRSNLVRVLTASVCIAFFGALPRAHSQDAPPVRFIRPNSETGSSQAVVVTGRDQIHTSQIFPVDGEGRLVGSGDVHAQLGQLQKNLSRLLEQCDSSLADIVKIQAYAANAEAATAMRQAIAHHFSGPQKPAVIYVETPLPHPEALVACDVVAVSSGRSTDVKRIGDARAVGGRVGSAAALLPQGARVYISGQAEKGDGSLADATRQTLASLGRTLEYLKLNRSHVVHVKAFLTPMSDVAAFEREVETFFAGQPAAPVAVVEWESDLPVEIEMVVAGGSGADAASAVEFLTPPGMTSSPVFARVTRATGPTTIYLAGLYGDTNAGNAAKEVTEIFDTMQRLLGEAGSDLKHLVKATYYVATNETSAQLNELRPRYYDPNRPPAASKAVIAGVAHPRAGLTLDMIAVPVGARPAPE